jgi:putative spermidine/putrescine transport system ATP-binding protein
VARFIGGQNVLAGGVDSAANGIAILAGEDGARFTLPLDRARPAPGSRMYFAIRRDRVNLARAPDRGAAPDKPNAIRGTVHAIEYQGTYVKVTIEVAGPEEFVANVSDGAFFADPLEIGDPVLASWEMGAAHLLEGSEPAEAAPAPLAAPVAAE